MTDGSAAVSKGGGGVDRPRIDRSVTAGSALVLGGPLLVVLTASLYRFWFLTHLRRHLWRRTSLGGAGFEYLGTPRDVLIGTLRTLAYLLPIFIVWEFSLTLAPVPAVVVVLGCLVALSLFSRAAAYRNMRFRLSRTLWRGLRFGRDGSALRYALLGFGLTLLVPATLGLFLPFKRAALERYRIGHTRYGDRTFDSRASGRAVFLRFLGFWSVTVGPAVAAAGLLAWRILGQGDLAAFADDPDRLLDWLADGPVTVIQGIAIGWSLIAWPLLWPLYAAAEFRAFVGATRWGPVRLASDLRARDLYGAILLQWGASIMVIAAVVGTVALLLATVVGPPLTAAKVVPMMVAAYVCVVAGLAAVRVTVRSLRVPAVVLSSITVAGLDGVETAAAPQPVAVAFADDFGE